MSDLRSRFEETETARFWMHRTVKFDHEKGRYCTDDIKYSSYAQIINAAWMMFQELNK